MLARPMPNPVSQAAQLSQLLPEVRACQRCAATLQPRPVLRLATASKIMVVGQAPGTKVHASGVPWDDASGEHLRAWLGVDRKQFDNPDYFGILPMAFCYPGKASGGDAPPPAICAETWHGSLTQALASPQLWLLIGMHAQKYYLGKRRKNTLTATVRAFASYGQDTLPLPHPSWRSKLWMRKNPWFEQEVLPELRRRVAAIVAS